VSGARRRELPRRRKRVTVERKKRSRSKIIRTAGTWLHPLVAETTFILLMAALQDDH